jgi:hypothetical protein
MFSGVKQIAIPPWTLLLGVSLQGKYHDFLLSA